MYYQRFLLIYISLETVFTNNRAARNDSAPITFYENFLVADVFARECSVVSTLLAIFLTNLTTKTLD